MAAKGAWAKQQAWDKILASFDGAFVNEKEIRIPFIENGERVEIKVTLTCAKVNVGGDAANEVSVGTEDEVSVGVTPTIAAPSEKEQARATNFLAQLGF